MIVSVFVETSSPACSAASSSPDSGLPCASVRLSMPTSRMSIAPSWPPPPSSAVLKWKMPPSKERILPQATPVLTITVTAINASTVRAARRAPVTASVSAGISQGYWREARIPGSRNRRARLEVVAKRIVISGAGGQVGRFLAGEAARRGFEVSALTHREWDITDPTAAVRFVAENDLVVNCAAFTNVDAAEADPDGAYAINATGAENVAHACARVGAHLVHISTDYVFGGEQRHPYEVGDTTNPLGVYGHSKLAGELAVLAALPDANIVRTSWVYTGGAGTDFVAVMRRLAATDRTVDVVDDQIGSPTYAKDLVGALLEVGEGRIREPILHAANDGAISRFQQARAVFEEVGADPERVRPVSTAQAPRPARRPVYSALSMSTSVRAGLTPLRPWRQALADALAQPVDDGRLPSTP